MDDRILEDLIERARRIGCRLEVNAAENVYTIHIDRSRITVRGVALAHRVLDMHEKETIT